MGRWAIINTILGLILLVLGYEIAITWTRTLPPVDFSARAVEETPPSEGGKRGEGRGRARRGQPDKAQQSPATMVTSIVGRDLFDPSRQKPQEEVKAAAPKEAAPPPNLSLVGVRIMGKDREAFVQDATQGSQQKRMRIGDEVGGYSVKAIAPRRVTLVGSTGDLVKLDLTVDKGAGAPGAPGKPPVPGVRPPVPGAPPGASTAASTAAGVQGKPSPAAGVGGRQPAGPGAAQQAQQHQGPNKGVTPPVPPPPAAQPGVPNLPAGVKEKLEQLKGQ